VLPAVGARVVERQADAALRAPPGSLDTPERRLDDFVIGLSPPEVLVHGSPSLSRGT